MPPIANPTFSLLTIANMAVIRNSTQGTLTTGGETPAAETWQA